MPCKIDHGKIVRFHKDNSGSPSYMIELGLLALVYSGLGLLIGFVRFIYKSLTNCSFGGAKV